MEVSSLRREVRALHEKNEKTKLILSDLTTNKQSMEKFARETYFMKRENEDVYVFKERAEWCHGALHGTARHGIKGKDLAESMRSWNANAGVSPIPQEAEAI